MGKNSFIMYQLWGAAIEHMTDAQAGALLKAIYSYQETGNTEISDPAISLVFDIVRQKMDEDSEKYDQVCSVRSANGKKGGRPVKASGSNDDTVDDAVDDAASEEKANGFSEKQTKAKKANGFSEKLKKQKNPDMKCNDSDSDNDSDNDMKCSDSDSECVFEKNKGLKDKRNSHSQREPAKPVERVPYQQIIDDYNKTCTDLAKVEKLTDARKHAIRVLLRKGYTPDQLHTVFLKAQQSDFLAGRRGRWKAAFDWLLDESNMVKVLEGQYSNGPDESARSGTTQGFNPSEYLKEIARGEINIDDS